MLFMNHYKRCRKDRRLVYIFQSTYEIKKNFKINKHKVAILFPKERVAVEFGEYDNSSKRIMELEKSGLHVFNIPDNEDVFSAASRLLYILKSV
jgi:hypothetical protein